MRALVIVCEVLWPFTSAWRVDYSVLRRVCWQLSSMLCVYRVDALSPNLMYRFAVFQTLQLDVLRAATSLRCPHYVYL